jgi:hypothetical protein
MDLEQRTRALLELVEQYQIRRAAELREPARLEAGDTVRAALAESRRRVRTAISEERKRHAAEVGAAEAALATERRLACQRHAVHLLGSAWQALQRRMAERWSASATRARWVDVHLQRALAAVPREASGWRIEHHPGWTADERARCAERLRREGVADVHFVVDDDIRAGFRVVSGHNVFDATVAGLTADRTQLEGRLLHRLDELTPA